MATIVGLSGSHRKGSFNASLLAAMKERAPNGMTIDVQTIAGIPLYDGDLEKNDGVPAIVEALKDRIAAADGLLLVTPEYNNGIPGTFKNAIDWLSRPAKDIARVFGDKPVALVGATPGPGGTRLAQAAWLPVLRTLGTRLFTSKQLFVGNAAQVFDAEGKLTDDKMGTRIEELLAAYQKLVG